MLTPGYLIAGRYRLIRLLGEGGMGSVWAAVNEAFGRNVAIKIMLRAVAADPTAMERFHNEARICGTIRHPGIVDVLDVGQTEDGSPFLVMELLEGEPLDGVLRRTGTLRPLDILPVVRDVARAMSLAHERGVIHRDVKPANIFLHRLPNGQIIAKILDFGISKVPTHPGGPKVTQADVLVGSPAYMSPEQAAGRVELDPRSDVYGLGVILYEALSGRLPFLEATNNALIIQIAVHEAPPLGTVVSGLPKPVLELVKASMDRDRDARIGSATALAERIEATLAMLGASPSLALPDPASLGRGSQTSASAVRSATSQRAVVPARRRSPVLAAALATTAIVVLGGAGLAAKLVLAPAPAPVASATPVASAAPAPPTASAAPVVTAAVPVVTAAQTAPPPASAAPTGAGSARKTNNPQGKKKEKGGAWGYD
jgi:serine/threonine-protein kinase